MGLMQMLMGEIDLREILWSCWAIYEDGWWRIYGI